MKALDDTMLASVTQTQLLTIPSSGLTVIPANLRRVALVVQPGASGQLKIRLGTNGTDGGFISIGPGDLPLALSLRDYGDIIRREFSVSGTAADTFLFSETLCPCG